MKIYNMPSGMLGVNTYLAVDEKTNTGFIVDPGGYNNELTKKIKENNIEIKYIIITHGHSDHICGVNEHSAEFPNAKVVACKHEEMMLLDPQINQSANFATPYSVKADMLVEDGDMIPFANMQLQIFHTPGHTEGGMCIYIADVNVLFSGDTLFRQSIGRTDFPGGSFAQIKDSIRNKLFLLPDETDVFPGHMDVTTIGFEKNNNPFV